METEILKQVYAALNRNDISGFLKFFDPNIERIEFEGSPSGGVYRGYEGFKAHVIKGRSTWAEGSCTPERFIISGDKVVVDVHVHVRQKDKVDWIDGRVADGFAFKNGKITQMNSYFELKDALKWAGVEESP